MYLMVYMLYFSIIFFKNLSLYYIIKNPDGLKVKYKTIKL